jgi:integrase
MAVYKTAEGRYKVVLDDVVRAGAPRRRRSYGTFRTRKAAERKQQAILDSRERGEDVDAEPQTMQQLVDAYIRDREIRGRSPVTIHTYRKLWDVRLRDRIGHLDADTMRPMTLKKAYDDLLERGGAGGAPLSASTVHDVHGFVSAVLTWAKRLELVKRNVAESVEPPSVPKRRPTPYQPSEVERLILAAKDDRFLPLVLFVISTGLRRGELTALRWDDVDLERAQVHVRAAVAYVPKSAPFRKEPKTDRHRTVALGETALYALRRQRAAQAAEKLKLGPK